MTISRRCTRMDKIQAVPRRLTRRISPKTFATRGNQANQLSTTWDLSETPHQHPLRPHLVNTIIWKTSWSKKNSSKVTSFYEHHQDSRPPLPLAATRNRSSSSLSPRFSQRNALRCTISCLPVPTQESDRLAELVLQLGMSSRLLWCPPKMNVWPPRSRNSRIRPPRNNVYEGSPECSFSSSSGNSRSTHPRQAIAATYFPALLRLQAVNQNHRSTSSRLCLGTISGIALEEIPAVPVRCNRSKPRSFLGATSTLATLTTEDRDR